jgi:hypothetical protein
MKVVSELSRRVGARMRRSAVCATACFLAASAAAGQTRRVIRGTVLDPSDRPIPSVALVVTGGTAAVTDDSGRFRLELTHRERAVFDARRVGYMPTRVGLSAGGDTTVSILMLPSAQVLPKTDIKSPETRSPMLAGFDERMRARTRGAGVGVFMTAADIEQRHATRITQVFDNIPSIFVRRAGGDRFALFGKASTGGECPATIYLDGIRLAVGTPGAPQTDRRGRVVRQGASEMLVIIDDYVSPSDVEGVEIYPRGLLAPAVFSGADYTATKCAIIAFWTKHYEKR